MTMTSAEWDATAAVLFAEFRANGGVVGGEYSQIRLLILHTRDRRDGRERENMLMYREERGQRIIIASHSGLPDNPDWYNNLMAAGAARIEVAGLMEAVEAVEVFGAERERLYALQAQLWPDFAEYETKTARRIPVIALTRAAPTP